MQTGIAGNQLHSFTVLSEHSGKRLDAFLAGALDGWSRAQVQEAVAGGAVRVNGERARKSHKLTAGELVEVTDIRPSRAAGARPASEAIPLQILFEDDHIIAINKPAGLVVHPGNGNWTGTVVNALLYHADELAEGFAEDRPGIVHRLDKDTSGVLLTAKTEQALAILSKQFADRVIRKTYYGFCLGLRPLPAGSVDEPVGRSKRDPTRFCVSARGRPARTEYECVDWRSGIAFMRFLPHTGRTHQIRVHAAHTGRPIVGDDVYGGDRRLIACMEPLERPFAWRVVKCFSRHALHAHTIQFTHPATKVAASIVAPFPDDFKAAAACFGDELRLEQL